MRAYIRGGKLMEIVALALVVLAMAMVVRSWELLPEQTAAALGITENQFLVVDSKSLILAIMLGMFAIYFILSLFMRFHSLYSFPVRLTADNRKDQHELLKSAIRYTKGVLISGFAYGIYVIAGFSLSSKPLWLGIWMVALIVLLLIATWVGYRVLAAQNA